MYYDIFKPHIVEFNDGTYAVRKFSIMHMGFVFLDADKPRLNYWWFYNENLHHAKVFKYGDALKLYSELKKPENPNKVKRVLHG